MKIYLKIINLIIFLILFSTLSLFSQNQELARLLQEIENIADSNKIRHYEIIADEYIKISDYTTAIVYYKKGLDLNPTKKEAVSLENKIGRTYYFLSDYDKSIEYLNKALILAEKINDTINQSLILNNIGIIYQKTGNYQKSIEYLNKSLKYKILLNDSVGIGNTYNNLGIAFYQVDLDKSLQFYEKALNIREIINDSIGIAVSYNNIGLIYFQQNNYSIAYEYFKSSLKIKEKINDQKSIAITLNNIAEVLLYSEKYSEAIEYSNKSLEIAIKSEAQLQIANSYSTLSSCYEKKNDYKSAYKYHKLYKETRDSIFNLQSQNKIAVLETKYQLTKKEQEIEINNQQIQLLERENKLKQIIQNFFIIGIILFFIIIFIVIYILILRNKNTKQKLIISREEKQIKNLEIDKQNLKIEKQNIENQKLKDELELKKRELTSKAMMLVKNNKIILNILKDINEIKQNANNDTSNEINNLIKKYKITKNDFNWQEFKLLFEEVHQDFYTKLTQKFPNLTPAERKLCAFLRLNLSTKEIAAITFKSPSTIKTTRKRLRKKLNIPTKINLVSFLSKIG